MPACTFFGHRECYGLDKEALRQTVEDLILQGVDTFYVGNQGQFDGAVRSCLRQLQEKYPGIQYAVVLAYLPTPKQAADDLSDTMYPEGLEGHPKYAIERRNRWMLKEADCVVCFVRHPWGGAYKFSALAKKLGKPVINLCRADTEFV